jgi:hypothetical protein
MRTVTYTDTIQVIECTHEGCGVTFGITRSFMNARHHDRKTFYCPNGHSRWYPGETVDEKIQNLTGQLDQERTRLREVRDRANRLSTQLDYSRRATKANATRLKKVKHRVAHGVCPCCQRTFKQLAAHMSSQHPTYIKADSE